MTATFAKTQYVVGEPVRAEVLLKNDTSELVRIMEVSRLTPNMDFVHMEIRTPSGRVERRRSRSIEIDEVFFPGFVGEPLKPDEAVWMVYYPNESSLDSVEQLTESADEEWWETFRVQGRYTVKFVYEIPDVFRNLPVRNLESNPVTLEFRRPRESEAAILEAVNMHRDWLRASEADPVEMSMETERALRRVIKRYPSHEMTKYAKLALANGLSNERHEEALDILAELNASDRSFRPIEVSLLVAINHRYSGKPERGAELLGNVISREPLVKSNDEFMWEYFVCRYPDAKGGSTSPVSQWRRNRLNGLDDPVAAIDEGSE